MECCLDQADAWETLFSNAIHCSPHQLPAGASVLCGWVDCDRTDAGNWRTLVHAVAADNLAVRLGHYTKESWMLEHERHDFGRDIGRREVGRKIVMLVERGERLVADAAAGRNIGRLCSTDGY